MLVAAVAFMATVTFYAAQQFSRRAADTRASSEAISFAEHSGTLATGDAFDGYIQMLRYADDPVVHSKASTREARVGAMQQLLYLNINKFSSLTIADRSGLVLASTDPSIVTCRRQPDVLRDQGEPVAGELRHRPLRSRESRATSSTPRRSRTPTAPPGA